MLSIDEQNKLLTSCERLVGRELAHARGQLKKREKADETIWGISPTEIVPQPKKIFAFLAR